MFRVTPIVWGYPVLADSKAIIHSYPKLTRNRPPALRKTSLNDASCAVLANKLHLSLDLSVACGTSGYARVVSEWPAFVDRHSCLAKLGCSIAPNAPNHWDVLVELMKRNNNALVHLRARWAPLQEVSELIT